MGIVSGTRGCDEAVILPGADNRGYVTVWNQNTCTSAKNVPAGNMGVRIRAWRGGAACSSWTVYAHNSASAHLQGIGGFLCSNPAGLQNFQTQSQIHLWAGANYTDLGSIFSPAWTG